MQQPVPQKRSGPATSPPRRQHQTLVVSFVTFLGVSLLGFANWLSLPYERKSSPEPTSAPQPVTPLNIPAPIERQESAPALSLVGDDGNTLWESPTAGDPIDLRFLPPGCQLFLSFRPVALLAHPDWKKLFAALGPAGQKSINYVERVTHLPLTDIDHLLIGMQVDRDGEWRASFVVHPSDPAKLGTALGRLSADTKHDRPSDEFFKVGEWAYFPRGFTNGKAILATPLEFAPDILELGGTDPPLRRETEQLVSLSDAQRHVSILFAPGFLFSDGKSIFRRLGSRLQEPLDWFLDDQLRAVSLSMHWADDFFLELRAVATLDTRAHLLANRLAAQLETVPNRVDDFLSTLDIQPYGHRLIARLPAMTRTLARYTRHGDEGDCAVLRTYLPLAAGHNLLMATELSLVEPLHSESSVGGNERPSQPSLSIAERLARPASLSFARETLETALQLLAEEIGVRIEIIGPDLQRDGITRNQMVGIDTRDQLAEQILLDILQQANPDKSASGPADPRQKLVYFIRPAAAGVDETLLISTRAAVAQRSNRLPAAFRSP